MVKENGTVMGTKTDYDINGILEVATEESLNDGVEDDDVKRAFADARANGQFFRTISLFAFTYLPFSFFPDDMKLYRIPKFCAARVIYFK